MPGQSLSWPHSQPVLVQVAMAAVIKGHVSRGLFLVGAGWELLGGLSVGLLLTPLEGLLRPEALG